jgi:WD40 repeat protein
MKWHPTSSFTIGSASIDGNVKIWDVQSEKSTMGYQGIGQAPWSMEWNTNGSMLGVIGKDKKMHLFDPRSSSEAMVSPVHLGNKPQKMQWVGDSGKIITVGASEYNERQYAIWDIRGDINTPLAMKKLDNHNLPMQTHYDRYSGMFYVVNRQQTFTQFFHFEDLGGPPELTPFDKFVGKENTIFMYFMPKKCVDFTKNEINRAIRITTKHAEWITFRLPLKSSDF